MVAGRKTRQAAKDLLRTYGRAGTDAFMAVNRYNGRGASGHTAGAGYNGPAAAGVDPALYNGAYGASAGVNGTLQSHKHSQSCGVNSGHIVAWQALWYVATCSI